MQKTVQVPQLQYSDKVVDVPVPVVQVVVVPREGDTAFAVWSRSWRHATDHGEIV